MTNNSRAAAPSSAFEALAAVTDAGAEVLDTTMCQQSLNQIRRVRGWLDSLEGGVSRRLNELSEQGRSAPAADEHTRCSGTSAADARARDRRSKTLGEAASFDSSLATGDISTAHVDQLSQSTARLDKEMRDKVLEHEGDLLESAKARTPEEFGRDCRSLVAHLEREEGISRAEQQRRRTRVSCRLNSATGMYDLRGELTAEDGARVKSALRSEARSRRAALDEQVQAGAIGADEAESYTHERLEAEALVDYISGGHATNRPNTPDLVVLVDARTLTEGPHEHTICETSDGTPIPPETAHRLTCFANVVASIIDEHGAVLQLGTKPRLANRAQRRALRSMYRTCAFKGCNVEFDRCEMHHVHPYLLGGPTDLENLVPLCPNHHHRAAHGSGWALHLEMPTRRLTITAPSGAQFISYPDMAGEPRRSSESTPPGSQPPAPPGSADASARANRPKVPSRSPSGSGRSSRKQHNTSRTTGSAPPAAAPTMGTSPPAQQPPANSPESSPPTGSEPKQSDSFDGIQLGFFHTGADHEGQPPTERRRKKPAAQGAR